MKVKFFKYVCVGSLALMNFCFFSCEKDDDEKNEMSKITFEDVDLGSSNYWTGSDMSGKLDSVDVWGTKCAIYSKDVKSGNASFHNEFNATYSSFEGFVFSKWANKTTEPVYEDGKDLVLYAETSETGTFAIAFSSASIELNEPKTVTSLEVNNTTLTYKIIEKGNAYTSQTIEDEGFFYSVKFKGIDANGKLTGEVEFKLADNSKNSFICKNWTKVDLSSLGKVKKIDISFDGSDGSGYLNTPAYVAIDNIIMK